MEPIPAMAQIAYEQLSIYTLHHVDERFVHQYIVDTYTAQTATMDIKPITIVLALVGLYLHVEHGYTGRQIQDAHMKIANRNPEWPALIFPNERGTITADIVGRQGDSKKRDNMIELWAAAVWFAWKDSHQVIKNFVQHVLPM